MLTSIRSQMVQVKGGRGDAGEAQRIGMMFTIIRQNSR